VQIEVKWLAGVNGMSIEMAGAEDKWTGRIRKAAGALAIGDRCEDARVGARVPNFAGAGVVTLGHAGDAPENKA
jgi:hypothetical protein